MGSDDVTASGSIADISKTVGDASTVINLATYFSVPAPFTLVYALGSQSGALPGSATISGAMLTIPNNLPVSARSIVIRASVAGFADSYAERGFTLLVVAAPVTGPGLVSDDSPSGKYGTLGRPLTLQHHHPHDLWRVEVAAPLWTISPSRAYLSWTPGPESGYLGFHCRARLRRLAH